MLRCCQTISKWAAPSDIVASMVRRFQFHPILPNTYYCPSFFVIAILVGGKWYLTVGLICSSRIKPALWLVGPQPIPSMPTPPPHPRTPGPSNPTSGPAVIHFLFHKVQTNIQSNSANVYYLRPSGPRKSGEVGEGSWFVPPRQTGKKRGLRKVPTTVPTHVFLCPPLKCELCEGKASSVHCQIRK